MGRSNAFDFFDYFMFDINIFKYSFYYDISFLKTIVGEGGV